MIKATVYITLKEQVSDPEGEAVKKALESLNFNGVRRARMGKVITLILEEENLEKAARDADSMCARILANPVIENYRVEIESVEGEAS